MDYKCVPFHEVGHIIASNMKDHYEQMGIGEGLGPVDADWRLYLESSAQGECPTFIMEKNGAMCGYAVFLTGNNINYKNTKEAMNSAIYIWPEYRGIGTVKFLRWVNEYLISSGIDEIIYAVSDDRIGSLLGKIGMKQTQKIWTIKNE